MNAGTSNTEKYAQVPASPTGPLAVTINTILVVLLLQHRTKDRLNLLLDHFLLLLFSSRLVGHCDPRAWLTDLQFSRLLIIISQGQARQILLVLLTH